MKLLTASVALFSFIAFTPVGAIAAEETEEQIKARKKAEEQANRVHQLSVFSYVNPVRGRVHGRRYPVLITLNVKGTEALSRFCLQKPVIGEAVLKVFGWGPSPDLRDKKVLARQKKSLHDAFDDVFPTKTLKTVSLKMGRSASEFGKQLQSTKEACSIGN
ncbi:MAG: hypothetical protein GKS01_17120 [Alphaproteobacteria bacterium]|nr:hypothetical protein [Alphaproteobacteria bacterium]